jgi:SAM-dependent methyltransferase
MNTPNIRDRIYEHYLTSSRRTRGASAAEVFKSRAPYVKRLIREHFPSNRSASIIDLGCGEGALLHFARELGYQNVAGVDWSSDQVQEARRLGVSGVTQGDLMKTLTALPDQSLDLVIAFDVLEHCSRDELLPFVDDVRRVLKVGGRWIIHVPNAESPFFGRVRYGDLTHEQAFTRTSLEQLLCSSGFRSVRCYEDVPVIHGLKSTLRFTLWKLIRVLLRLYLAAETGSSEPDGVFSQNLLAIVDR